MKQRRLTEVVGAVFLLAMLSAPALADTHKAQLEGFQEVPALSTPGAGECRVKIRDEVTIEVVLSYSDLSAAVTQAHLHFGHEAVNGGIVLFLCSNLGNGPAGTPTCPLPPAPGEVTRTLTSADVI